MKIMVVSPPTPLRGRRRLLSSDIAEELHENDEMLIESPSLLLDEIGEWLAIYPDQPISTRDARRTIVWVRPYNCTVM
jgi:hypothetical protein